MRRSAKALHLLVAVTVLTGCVSHSGIATADITPRTVVSVRFAGPRALVFKSASTDTLAVDDVVELQGRMIRMNADSMTIRTTEIKRAVAGAQQLGPGATTTFAMVDVQIRQFQRHPARTFALVVSLALGLALLLAVVTYDEPPPPPPPEPKPK